MKCLELMKRDVVYVLDSSLVTEAAIAMRDRGVGFLPVCDELGRTVGTLTDRDVVVRVLGAGKDPAATPVGEAMTAELVACSPEDELWVAEDLMGRFQRSRIVCIDAQRHARGVISLSDVAAVGSQGHAGLVLTAVAEREAAPRRTDQPRTCAHVMSDDVVCVDQRDHAAGIAEQMRERRVGLVVVCDDRGALVGVVTDRDLVLRVVAPGLGGEARAADFMTRDVVTCARDEPLPVLGERMRSRHVSRIVCAHGRQPVGVVSLADLARVEPIERTAQLLRDVSARSEQIHL